MWINFNATSGAFQFERTASVDSVTRCKYRVVVDGLGLLMVLLTAIITPMSFAGFAEDV